MGTVTAIFAAIAEFCGWRKKVSRTPEQKEIQQARKERDATEKDIRRFVRDGVLPDSLRDENGNDKPK